MGSVNSKMDAPAINDTDKMNNQKLSSSFETLNSENDNDGKNRSRSVSPEITKFEEPGMFLLLDEEIVANRKGSQLGSSIRDIYPKAINLPNVGVVILHQEDPKMKFEESNGKIELLTRSETQVKDMAGNTETKSHKPNPFHVTLRQEDKLQDFKEVPSVRSIMNFLPENKMVEINSSRGRPKKKNVSNSKLQPTKKGDSNSVYKRSTRNIQPVKLGDHEKADLLDRNSIAGGLAIEKTATNDQIETAAVPTPSRTRRTRTSAVKPDVALEWSNIQVKFRVVSKEFYSNNDFYDLYPDEDPKSPSYQEDMRKMPIRSDGQTLEFLLEEARQRYLLRNSSTSKDARNMSTKFLSR